MDRPLPYDRKPGKQTTRVIDDVAEACQAPLCPEYVPPSDPTAAGWVRIDGIESARGNWRERESYMWFCSWRHLAAWAQARAGRATL